MRKAEAPYIPYPKMLWTIWRFRGITVPGENIVARQTEPYEIEHEYQQVIKRVMAYSAEEALLSR